MKKYFKIYLCFLFIILSSCENNNNEEVQKFLNSNDKTQIIRGCSLIKDKKDTIFVKSLLSNINDSRISHDLEFYGISVYEAKIKALKRISGLTPPNVITYKIDSLNMNFYKKWAIRKGYIK